MYEIYNNVPFPYNFPEYIPNGFDLPKMKYDGLWQPIVFYAPITQDFIPNIDPNRYIVMSNGMVYDCYKRKLKYKMPNLNTNRYSTVWLTDIYGNHYSPGMHEVVAFAFCKPIEIKNGRHEVNHIDGIKFHNEYYNLEHCSGSDNKIHAYNNGLRDISLNLELVHLICQMIQDGYSNSQIVSSVLTNVESSNKFSLVNNIRNGDNWSHISRYYNIPGLVSKYIITEYDAMQVMSIASKTGIIDELYLLSCIRPIETLNQEDIKIYLQAINDMLLGIMYPNITKSYNINYCIPKTHTIELEEYNNKYVFTEDQVRKICEALQLGISYYPDLCKYAGIIWEEASAEKRKSYCEAIKKIRNRTCFNRISDDYIF